MTLNKEEAIKELEWLMSNYRELLSWNQRVERLMIACKMGAESLKDDPEDIDWILARQETRTSLGLHVKNGFGCSNCGEFSQEKQRYCSHCGGIFRGSLKKTFDNQESKLTIRRSFDGGMP